MEKALYATLSYFAQFDYPATVDEVWAFLPMVATKKSLQTLVHHLIQNRKVEASRNNARLTLVGYASLFSIQSKRQLITNDKKKLGRHYLALVSHLPWVRLVGYSGSVSMNNAVESDDIDLFMISKPGRIWTTRFCAVILSILFGLKRPRNVKYARNKICLNLFFDERDMRIPKAKQTAYVAHEVLQMQPIISLDRTYERFITANSWVFTFYPNARTFLQRVGGKKLLGLHTQDTTSIPWIGDLFEGLLRTIQLYIMRNHRTTERIGMTQLWFFPDDFENRLQSTK